VRRLPAPLTREVLDFIEYLEAKHGLTDHGIDEVKSAQLPTMERIWSNIEDDIWNDW
jgi:hypothetical protein